MSNLDQKEPSTVPSSLQRAVVLSLSLEPDTQRLVNAWADERGLSVVLGDAMNTDSLGEEPPVLVLVGGADGLDALHLVSSLRAENESAQIFFVDDGPEKVGVSAALLAGADDAACPQGEPEVFVARLDAKLRRASGVYGVTVQVGPLFIDLSSQRVVLGGVTLMLRNAEFKVIAYLARHSTRPVSAAELRDRGLRTAADDHTIRNHVYELRRKLRMVGFPELVRTIPGSGYQLALSRRPSWPTL